MVMEASPSPQSVGREFVRQYYTLLNKAPAHLHRFYNNYSSFVHGGLDAPNRETLPVIGQKQIHNRIQQLNFRDCHAKISQVDAQATLGNGVVVQVTGELSNGGAPMRRFTQTFVLAAQSPKKYYVHNDIFRYQDIVFSDEEGSGSGRSEGEEEEGAAAGGYFPPAPNFPAPFPAPPAPPHAPLLSPPAPAQPAAPPSPSPPAPHLNGHPPQHDDATRHLVSAMQVSTISSGASVGANTSVGSVELEEVALEPEPEPEPEREPSPPPQPTTPVAPEPKTYANLLKSGSSSGAGAPRGSPPAAAPAPVPAPAPAPAPYAAHPPAHHEPRPRPPRNPQPPQQSVGVDSGRRYSDAQQLFLGNLPHSATEDELRALFARFGPVAELRVHSKPAAPGAPRHPNYGFITYESAQAAADCLNAAPLFFPAEGGEGAGVKLNVEEKKMRGREPPRRRPLSSHRAAFQPRQPYRR
ncbi:ras GTPase-activating protein-binding protein 2 isoform X4 [Bicyclus anynana]|uniref:Ras GTPase-activating protein-binding protein 2 isoform X4 n=1 Tax=Bicyclus anynana TaxID=110368 RepID=A0ABM3LLJ4_BICAN|nr:ras GTPase-activating protein-binding protein 2 isoform X4 [Bicyclus anynana]